MAGGSEAGQRGRQGSDGNAPSGGRAENGARTATDKGRTVPNDTERGGQGDIRHSSGRQQDNLGTSEGEVRLSDEIDENGRQFVLTSNGQLSFGEITEESGLTPAPILLSEGIITNPATNDGYGLVHIEARHGDQIRKAGYKSVIEFIEDVAQNYERVKEGNIRNGNPTYLIQLKDKHNNTLIVELSSDGNYWNINTAGIFKESYGKNRREIYNRHTTVQQSAETVGASQEAEQSGTTTSSSMNAPTSNIVSETPVKTEPQQPNNAVSTGSSLSENEVGGITSSEPNGKPTVSESKDKKTSAETSQERQKNDSNLSEAFKQQMNIRIGQLSKFIKTKDGKLKKKYESLRKTPFFAIFDSGNIYEGPVAIAKTPREALNVAFNYDIGDFEVLYVDFRTKSLDMDLLSIYDVSGFRGDVYDENGAYKDEAKNLLVERISRLGKGNSTEVQGVEDFQQRESGADALQGNADENIRRAESEVERNPTEAQKEAGNYRKGHVRVDGLDVTIENPKGSVRSGTDADGKRWENVMNNTYGYMRGTEGVDGDHIDVFLSDNPESGNVYVVDQRDPKTGEFDEHKVMYGFGSMEEARDAYLKNYTPGWQGLGTITEVSKEEFRKWIGSSRRKTKPFAEYRSVKKEAGQNEDVRQSRDVSSPLSAEEAAIRDAIVERLRESGIEVITDAEAGQRVLDEANGRGEPVRTQAMLDGLKKASDFILSALGGKTKQRKARIEIPERANRLAEEAIGHPIKSHAININELVHIKKRHGENGTANDANSIPLRDEDIALMPYIMAAPTRVIKGSMAVNGTESVRYEKDLDNGVVVVVEREGRFDVEDMENITMWAKKKPATNVTVAEKASHSTSETIVISETDSAKIRKDAEDAIHGDEKVREHRVYHGSGADFEVFDHSHMGEGEGAQATTGGRKDGARNYVIFDEKDLQITDHVRFFRTPGGEAYGFTVGGKIYIDPRTTTADTPIHEYAHLWAGALRQANPKEWNNIVELMRDTPAWDEVKRLYPELESDEEIADEALAMYSGRRGAERLREAARRAWDGSADLGAKAAAARAMGRVRDALRRFWQNVADLLHFRHISAEEVADRVMRDLMEGVNPNRIKSATDNTGAFSAGNDDIRYSRAEEDKSLVAVHNTSEENLKKALELGGFPMPSIAVTKADVGHTEFGEISLVFGRESIDPTDRRNKVYGEDAWTPTFPQTGYKLDEKKTNDIYRRANKAGSLPLFNPVTFHPDNYESYISGLDSKSLVEHFKDDYGAKQLYLYENGNAVDEWERHEVEKYLPDQVALSTKLLEEIGLERLKGEKDETLEYEVKRIVNDHYGIDLDGMPPFRAKIRIGNAISRAVDYAENGNRKTEADAEATKRKIDARTDQKDFEKWLEDLFDGIVEKRGIRNDKDPFTASGNRRKWEQLYDEITLDNVVEAMRRQAARGGQGLFGGSIFGAAQEEYKDIDSIRKAAKRRIRMMSHEEAETGRKTITDRLSAIEIPGVGERFSDVMDMVQNIQDAVARSHTAKGIYKYLKAFYPKVTMETANEIADIVKDIQAMSARYFEAKPYRAVGFDEVRLAVVPSDTDAGLVEQLKRKGIPVREYERGNEAERRAIVEEATDEMELRFRETEEEDANRRNMEQASGMNVYVDGRTKAQAETLRKIDGLANRLEQERMAGAVREMAERLHLEGVEVVTDASTLTGRRARAKGFYSPRTGKISIVIPNHASEADAVQTLLHEAVAHKGLRQLFGEHFDTFLWNVYRNADRDVRERINALASEKGWDFPTATEEYLASLAEDTDFENAQRSGWWEKIKRLFIDMLHKMGLDRFSGVTLSDNELRYILWRSYENLREPGAERSITGVAADVVKQAELKVGNYAEEATGGNMAAEENDDDLMYRFIGERGASRLDAEEEATTRLDNLDLARRMEQAYNDRKARIEKLRGAKPVKIKGDEIEPSEDLKQYKKNALEYGKKLRGEYTNKDTNETISLTAGNSRGGIREILQHDYKDVEHLQSIAAIPQIIENSIFIDELPNEDNKKYPGVKSFSYYVCGLKINGVDYTVKAVIANQSNGERYYDHKLTNIEKGELLSIVPTIQKAGIDSKTPYSSVKDKRLVSILQTDEKENARKIKVATGWERGADGKWRYETPDIKYTPVKNIEEGKFYQLSDFVNDKDLFNAYPELKFVKVVFRYEPDGRYGGYWNIGENLIDINTAHSTSNHYKNTLVHEIQHAIQDIEGFVPGGDRSLAYEYYIKDGEYLGNFNKNELNELYELRRMAERLVDEGKYKRIGNAINHVLKTAKENGYYLKWVVDDYDKTPYYVLQEYTSAELKKARDLNDEKFYMSISGEVEARNAEKRMGMSENKRRKTLAEETEDVAREDQIFLEKTLGDTKRGKSLSIFEDRNSAAEDGTRDTPLSSPTVHAWDRLAQSLKFQLRETAVDYLTAIDKFQDLIAKHSGRKIESFENAYDWMTFLSSRNRVEMDMFDSSVVRPLNNAILKLIKNGGTKQPIIFPCVF